MARLSAEYAAGPALAGMRADWLVRAGDFAGTAGGGEGGIGEPSRNIREMEWCGWRVDVVDEVVLLRVIAGVV